MFQPSGRQAPVAAGTTLLDAARRLGVDIDSICGGRQTCGKCAVVVETGSFPKHALASAAEHLSLPEAAEREYWARHTHVGERPGLRLACAACVSGDVLVTVPPESLAHKPIIRKSATERAIELDPMLRQMMVEVEPHRLGERDGDWERLQAALRAEWQLHSLRIDLPALRRLGPALRSGKQRVTVVVWNDAEVIDVQPGYHEGLYGLAVDIGSTTVAAHLCDLASGTILATDAMLNPQVTWGEDLMSRISYAMLHADGLETMRAAIVACLNRLAGLTAHAAGIRARDIHELVVVGNTVMHHLLLGLDPTELGAAPFTLATHAPLDIKARDLELKLHPGANVHCVALEAGHVGSDNVGVLVAEAPAQQDAMLLLIDVGTNAEIVLGNRERLLSASSPTGPAFEGAQITHGQRAAPGAIERVRIDKLTKQPRFKVIGNDTWSDEQPPATIGATGICGSGIIEAVAELFAAGVLRHDGRFQGSERQGDKETGKQGEHRTQNTEQSDTQDNAKGERRDAKRGPENLRTAEACPTQIRQTETDHGAHASALQETRNSELETRLRWNGPKGEYVLATADQTATGQPIVVTQDDIRNIQLAKAALYAGCKLLMRRRGVSKVDKIVLAGAFGAYIDPLHALLLGLFPDCEPSNIFAVGNAAGDGARMVLLNKARRAEAALVARNVEYIETAIDPYFQAEFVAAMHLPHMQDPFPHLDELGLLPERHTATPSTREERRRARQERTR